MKDTDDTTTLLFQITGLDRLQLVECKASSTAAHDNDDDSSTEEGSYANDSAVVAKKRYSSSTYGRRSSTTEGATSSSRRRNSSILTLGSSVPHPHHAHQSTVTNAASMMMMDSFASDLSDWDNDNENDNDDDKEDVDESFQFSLLGEQSEQSDRSLLHRDNNSGSGRRQLQARRLVAHQSDSKLMKYQLAERSFSKDTSLSSRTTSSNECCGALPPHPKKQQAKAA